MWHQNNTNNNGKKAKIPTHCVPNPGAFRPSNMPEMVLPSQKRCRVLDFLFWASTELFMFFAIDLQPFLLVFKMYKAV